MTTIKTFSELEVWKKAHQMVLTIYKITEKFPKSELFGLTSQIRRASASVPANIVEGFRRQSLKDSLHFYVIADASLEETKYHLLLSRDLEYIDTKNYTTLISLTEEVGRLLTRWIQSQRNYLKT
jgi:four helix bundle protein